MSELLKWTSAEVAEACSMHQWVPWKQKLRRIEPLLDIGAPREEMLKVIRTKYPDRTQLGERRARILSAWEILKERVARQIIPFRQLRQMLREAGCPIQPGHIGLSLSMFRTGIYKAQLIRTRYTVLDLADDIGILEPLVDKIIDEGAYFNDFLT